MEYLNSRLESFTTLKTKRSKASSSKLAPSSTWPHPKSFKATPDSLAEAGFYYNPDSDSPDNVTCFMCKKSLGGWEPDDDPFTIHYEKCRNTCAWAFVRCQGGVGVATYDSSDQTRHPRSKAMEKARLDTFSKTRWPHDSVKGHGANSRALAQAGFICNPLEPDDDTVVCLYCQLSLGGWDAEDDPYEEHLKRDKKNKTSCAFLEACEENSLGKSTKKRPASKVAAKPPTQSASQSLKEAAPTDSLETRADDSDDEFVTTTSNNPRSSSGRRSKASPARASSTTAKTPASRRSTRGTSTTAKTPGSRTVSSEVEETDIGSESDAGRRTSKAKKKTGGKTKARVSAIVEEEDEGDGSAAREDEDVKMDQPNTELETEPEPEPEPPRKKRGRPPKSAATKSVAKGRKARVKDEEDEVDAEVDADPTPPEVVKKMHGRTRSKANIASETDIAPSGSNGMHPRTKSGFKAKNKPAEEEEPVVEPALAPKKKAKQVVKPQDEEEGIVYTQLKKSKGKAISRVKPRTEPQESDVDDAVIEQDEQKKSRIRAESGRSATSRGPKTPKQRKSSMSEDAGYATAEPPPEVDHMDVDDEIAPLPQLHVQGDLVPNKAGAAPLRAASRSTAVDSDSSKRPSPVPNGVRSSSAAPSSRASTSRPPLRLNKDTLKVIEIDSDGEETSFYDAPIVAPAIAKPPVVRLASSSSVDDIKKPAGHPSKKKVQVEVVLPLPSRQQVIATKDAQIMDESPRSPVRTQPVHSAVDNIITTEPQLPGLETPISAVHRCAPPSPVHGDIDDGVTRDIRMPDPDADILASATSSPRTYHPFLAQLPIEKLGSLTEEEAGMTLEQFIRREMELQYVQLQADAERRINEFKEKAAATRRLIETS